MKYLVLDHMDGRYLTQTIHPSEIAAWRRAGATVIELEDEVYKRYAAHCAADADWQNWFTEHSNAEHIRHLCRRQVTLSEYERSYLTPNPLGPGHLPLGPVVAEFEKQEDKS